MAKPAILKKNEFGRIRIYCPKCEALIIEKNPIVEYGLTGMSKETAHYFDRQCKCGLRVRYYLDSFLTNISNYPKNSRGKEVHHE